MQHTEAQTANTTPYGEKAYKGVVVRAEKRAALYRRDEYQCVWCGKYAGDTGVELSLDHIIPNILGGDCSGNNLVTACMGCNNSRGPKTTRQFVAYLRDQGTMDEKGIRKRLQRARRRDFRLYYADGKVRKNAK